jgi:RimJ/RimL family protein N-acetyltransferase
MSRDIFLHLRRAGVNDALDLLAWRNDPHTRAMSCNSDELKLEDHLAWFSRALEDADRLILIAEIQGEKVGMVRFDRRVLGWEVSVVVAAACCGKGYGQAILREGLVYLQTLANSPDVTATVRLDNVASQRIFAHCGFHLVGSADGFDHLRWHGFPADKLH